MCDLTLYFEVLIDPLQFLHMSHNDAKGLYFI